MKEALRITQFEAPHAALGDPGQRNQPNRDLLIAVAEGELSAEIDAVEQFIQAHADSDDPVHLTTEAFQPIEFFLDAPGFPAWAPFGRTRRGWAIALAEGYVVAAESP